MGFFKALFGDHVEQDQTPVTLDEFYAWINDVIDLTRLPNNDSMQFAVCTIVLESKDLLSKKSAALRLEKGAQNQFASFVFQDIKTKRIEMEIAAQKEAELKRAQSASEECAKSPAISDYVLAPKSDQPTTSDTEPKPEAPEDNSSKVPQDGSEIPTV